jgi:hypothetical protein
MKLREGSEAPKLATVDLNDIMYSIEIKLLKKHPVNDKHFEDKQFDKLAEFDQIALAEEVKKRVPGMESHTFDDYKAWVSALRAAISPNKEAFLEELATVFGITLETKPQDAKLEIHTEVREKVDSGISDIINPS